MTFDEFKQNVRAWSEARGIYEHSTALAQALKAVSEVGELADSIIKGDREALIDAIGDVAVCLVNVAELAGFDLLIEHGVIFDGDSQHEIAASAAKNVAEVASAVACGTPKSGGYAAAEAMRDLNDLSKLAGTTFGACFDVAWNQIKDRKGRMVAGGAFVKESEA